MFGGSGSVSYFDESMLTDPAQSQDIFRGPVLNSGLEQPPFEEVERQDTLRDRLESMLGGIGQSELGAIWADPTMEEILAANSIRMNPEAPYDISQATTGQSSGITADALVELITFIEAIENAGGYEEWLAQQDQEGPPEELPTELEEEIDIGSDTIDTDVEVDPDMPIYIPFPDLPPREEGDEGEGENGEGTGAEGEGTDTGRGQDRGDGEEFPRGGGRGGGSIGSDPVGRSEEDPFRVVFGPIASSGSSGEGVGEGGVQPTSMLTPRFTPYMASIGYTPVAIPKPILPQAPIVSSLFSEFLS